MVTQAQVEALVRAHAENDLERFKSVTLQISADAERKSNFRFARDLKHLTEGTRVMQPLPMHTKHIVAQVIPKHTLDTLFLKPELKASLLGLVREWKSREIVRERGLDVRRRIVFTGPPGTGKTATAGALATALDVPFFNVCLESMIESYLGNTAKNLRAAFDAIKVTPGVFLFDEFDALAHQRVGGKDGDVGEIRRITNSLLKFLEEDGVGMVIAASNLDPVLDQAVWRRFEGKFVFPWPDQEQVEAITRRIFELGGVLAAESFTWDSLGSYTMPCGDESPLCHADIEEAARSVVRAAILDNRPLVYVDEMTTALRRAKRTKL
jgi:SpoVK/Ycf46/Vps4 family AAA+-type ATPase